MADEPNLTGRTSIQFPPDMKDMIAEVAVSNDRSFSAQVVSDLRKIYKMKPLKKKPSASRVRRERR